MYQVEPTKHNLRLMVLEDVLHYHPEGKGLIEHSPDAATAMIAPVSAERGGARAPPIPADSPTGITSSSRSGCESSSSKDATAAGSLTPTLTAKPPDAAAALQDIPGSIPEEEVGQERPQQTMQEVEARRVPAAADAPEFTEAKESAGKDDDDGPQGEPAWPPDETKR